MPPTLTNRGPTRRHAPDREWLAFQEYASTHSFIEACVALTKTRKFPAIILSSSLAGVFMGFVAGISFASQKSRNIGETVGYVMAFVVLAIAVMNLLLSMLTIACAKGCPCTAANPIAAIGNEQAHLNELNNPLTVGNGPENA